MPTYALLGATGSTGAAITRCLLAEPPVDLILNVLVRSKTRLLKAFPNIETAPGLAVTIFEGTPQDTTTLQGCLSDADVIFNCIGTNEATPGITLIEDTVTAVIAALRQRQQQHADSYKKPTILQLRSSSLNPSPGIPWLGKTMAHFFFHHVYADLERGCTLLQEAASSTPPLLDVIPIDPPAIHDPDGTTRTGHTLITDPTKEAPSTTIMYADLGAAFVEVAARREEFGVTAVLPSATGRVNETWGVLFGYMKQGFWSRVWG